MAARPHKALLKDGSMRTWLGKWSKDFSRYNSQKKYTRYRAVFPGLEPFMLMLHADCSLFTLKPACSSPYLPPFPATELPFARACAKQQIG